MSSFIIQHQAEEKEKIERLYGSGFYSNEIRRNRVENYSFGEFFRVLYFGSRLGLMSKEFIQVILASLSFVMPQFIEIEKKNYASTDELSYNWEEYNYKPIRDVFRYTLLGTWCEDLFDRRTVDIVVKKNGLNKENCKNFLSLLMLTPMSTGETIPVNDNGNVIRISAKLDPTAWFMNLIRINRIKALSFGEKNLKLRDLFLEVASSQKEVDELLGKTDNENHLQKKLLKGLDEKKILDLSWFLLKNIDITYNVVKRVVIYLIYLSDNNLRDKKTAKTTPVEAIKSFYVKFNEKLNEEFKIYNTKKSERWDFEDTFNKIPVVNLFMKNSTSIYSEQQPLRIEWSNSSNKNQKITLNNCTTLNDALDFCSASCPETISWLKGIFFQNLNSEISQQNARKIVSHIFDNQVGETITVISNILNEKGE